METRSELELALAKVDAGVLKRLRFVLKIMKAISAQSNARNRQAPAYFVEVFDAIGDWSGKGNEEISDMLDQQIFPQVCQFISTFSSAEFDSFQQFLFKYILGKWAETANFAVLSFISDIYGFLARFVPAGIADEYLELFMKEEMPPQISFVIVPAILWNLNDKHKHKISANSGKMSLLGLNNGEIGTEELKCQIIHFWSSLDSASLNNSGFKSTCILRQCLCSLFHLETLPDTDLINIIDNLSMVGSSTDFSRNDSFLLVSTILLSSVHHKATSNKQLSLSIRNLMDCIMVNANKCQNTQISMFVMKVLQKVMENNTEEDQNMVLRVGEIFGVNGNTEMSVDADIGEDVGQAVDGCLMNLFSDGYFTNEDRRKRIKLVVADLQKRLEA